MNCWGGTLWHASASPAVSISSPANNTIVDSPGSVTLTASATDSGTVTQVAFYQGATLIGTDTAPPYTVAVSNLAPGGYEFTAVATNNLGATTRSAPVRVMVAAQVYYVQVDHLNTPRLVSNAGSTAVWKWEQAEPFGDGAPNDNPSGLGAFTFNLRYPGQYFDVETGLSYNYFRDYDPAIGRYVQSDPVGLAGGINTYLYVGGNPMWLIDQFGLKASTFSEFLNDLFNFGAENSAEKLGEKAGSAVAALLCSNPPRDIRQSCFDGCVTKTSSFGAGYASAFQDACQIKCVDELSNCRRKLGAACLSPGS